MIKVDDWAEIRRLYLPSDSGSRRAPDSSESPAASAHRGAGEALLRLSAPASAKLSKGYLKDGDDSYRDSRDALSG